MNIFLPSWQVKDFFIQQETLLGSYGMKMLSTIGKKRRMMGKDGQGEMNHNHLKVKSLIGFTILLQQIYSHT